MTAFNFKNRKEAHRWAIDKYLDQTSKDYAYSYWQHERNLYTIDYAVAHKTFAFLLSFASAKNPQGGTYDQEEADMLDEIFAHLNPGSIILGWGESEEYIIQARCGEGGHALICTNVSPNLSFHAAIPTNIKSLKQKRQLDENSVTVENKISYTGSRYREVIIINHTVIIILGQAREHMQYFRIGGPIKCYLASFLVQPCTIHH